MSAYDRSTVHALWLSTSLVHSHTYIINTLIPKALWKPILWKSIVLLRYSGAWVLHTFVRLVSVWCSVHWYSTLINWALIFFEKFYSCRTATITRFFWVSLITMSFNNKWTLDRASKRERKICRQQLAQKIYK